MRLQENILVNESRDPFLINSPDFFFNRKRCAKIDIICSVPDFAVTVKNAKKPYIMALKSLKISKILALF